MGFGTHGRHRAARRCRDSSLAFSFHPPAIPRPLSLPPSTLFSPPTPVSHLWVLVSCSALCLSTPQQSGALISEVDTNNYDSTNNNSRMLMKDTIKGSQAFIPGNTLINAIIQLSRVKGRPGGTRVRLCGSGCSGTAGRAPPARLQPSSAH